VSFTKIREQLGFKKLYTPAEGAREIYEALETGQIAETPETNVIRWWKLLQDQEKVN